MPPTRVAANAFGAVTIALVALTGFLGLLCIYRCIYIQLRIKRRGFSYLRYFNGPWIIRVILIVVSIWWGFGEIVRLSFLRGGGRIFSSLAWQKYGCKFYVLSNLGFAEPIIFLILGFLLHAALQKREFDSLSRRWNWKTFVHVILLCLPLFILQLALILLEPKFNTETDELRKKTINFLMISFSENNVCICTYPLMSTIILGVFDLLVIGYMIYIGSQMLSLVINKGLRLRIYFLALSIIFFLPLRVLLLGFSVVPRAGDVAFELLVFASFLVQLSCNVIGISMLVYFPVADCLALREIGENAVEIDEICYDDSYDDGDLLIPNRSCRDSWRIPYMSMKMDDIRILGSIEERRPGSFDLLVESSL